ncbi:MAG: hypothetical protein AABW90_00065 [Nanoarchaeota archaeon]
MTASKEEDIPEEFNLRNPNLASFICDVTIEIDNHIIGRDKLEYNNVIRLGKLLYGLTSDQWKLTHYLSVFKGPIEDYIEKKFDNQAKIKDLTKELNKICDDLESMVLLPKKKQENLRAFYVDLSKKIMDYRKTYFSSKWYLVA